MEKDSKALLEAANERANGPKISEEGFTVVKRNGKLVPFQKSRILRAITAAFRDTKKIDHNIPLDKELEETIHTLTDSVTSKLLKLASKGASLTVEGIQDFVEVFLMKKGHHDVARSYIIYRDKRKEEREHDGSNLKIYRHDRATLVRFSPIKIASSIERCFRRAMKLEENTPEDVIHIVNRLTEKVVGDAIQGAKEGKALYLESVQDAIEKELMEEKYFDAAKDFILQRAEKEKGKIKEHIPEKIEEGKTFTLKTKDGTKEISESFLRAKFEWACKGYENEVSAQDLVEASILQFYEGIKEEELDLANIFAARSRIEKDPAYSKVASRLLLDIIYRETMGIAGSDPSLKKSHKAYFKKYLTKAIKVERISPKLLDYDLDKLADAIDLTRDDEFQYLGLQTLYDRYFIHHEGKRLETPQIFWMRVAMGLALEEDDKTKRAIEFYETLSSFHFVSSTPTLFNAGTLHSQLSSCYLSTVGDDLGSIFKIISDDAQLSKWAGGLGNDWTSVRATGSVIKGTNGKSQGVIPFLKVANDTAVAVNQCFAPETLIYTNRGILPIEKIKRGDLVLGIHGHYREVLDTYAYNQKDSMREIKVKHSIDSIHVTSGHPFYAIQSVPMEQAISRTLNWLEKGKVEAKWVDASQLKEGDYIAQVIPKEVVAVPEFTEEDARLYGTLLGDGHLSKNGTQWGVSGNPTRDAHLEFVRKYLRARNIHYWETTRGENYLQISWAAGRGAIRDGATGQYVSSGEQTLPFTHDDLYNDKKEKRIAPRLSHLPENQTLALIQGLIETDGNVSRGKEITFCSTSKELAEGMRYQLLRLGIPSSGNYRVREQNHTGKRDDGSLIQFNGTVHAYDVRIPADERVAKRVNAPSLTKKNWLTYAGHLFSRIKSVKEKEVAPFVFDLLVEGAESYMTTTALAHNGGKRKGAMCAYLETWHLDIEDFLELRKNTGDERRRTHDMNTANWIPDLFMKRVQENKMWTLFSPSDTPDLHDLYGKAFETRYEEYEKMVEKGEIKLFKKIEAMQLWRKMLSMLFETGHPWITFKDPSNIRSPQSHVGVVHSSNLCTEILLNTNAEETAVCNLGSVNLAKHCRDGKLDEKKIEKTVSTAIRMLDNVVDINFYPIPEAKNANLRHRPIGLGLMGFQDALYMQKINYASMDAADFADKSMEMISYYAILSSSKLAKERGAYATYKGSKWDQGLLPIDTIDLLEKERGQEITTNRSASLDWNKVREHIKQHGMRNSNTMAIAPTATIANITGITQSIEPMYKHLFVKSNLSGEFTTVNPHLVEELKQRGLWDEEMIDDLKYFDGQISEIERIPDEVKKLFPTAFEIEPDWLIECAARRQKWIDMGQSLNLYLAEPSGKKLSEMYLLAWEKGLKTTYYLRTLAATQIEKSSIDINKRGLQPRWMKNKSASSNIAVDRDKPIVCSMEEGCESCQ